MSHSSKRKQEENGSEVENEYEVEKLVVHQKIAYVRTVPELSKFVAFDELKQRREDFETFNYGGSRTELLKYVVYDTGSYVAWLQRIKNALQEGIEDNGHSTIMYPKSHCARNWIE
ncbi:hypothetical protein BDC45DRAFT_537066 [Circinella umbellata]|nr:hypothetical protein BDC45DRAFT_537066 [Circinella umbellata]